MTAAKTRVLLAAAAVLTSVMLEAQPQRPVSNGALPFVSPNGRQIAFTSNRSGAEQVYVIDVDGKNLVQLTNDAARKTAPGWTPDNRVLIGVARGDTTDLFASPTAGGTMTRIGSSTGQQPVLAPDGKRLLYTAVINRNFLAAQIRESDLDGRNETIITRDAGAHFNGAYSRDGKHVAYAGVDSATRDMQLWVVNRDGSGARQLTRFAGGDGRPQWPSWSFDGKTIAVQAGVYTRDNPAQNTAHIWLIDVATGKPTRIAAHDTPYLDETPSFLPDGRIAFQSNRTGRMEIWVMDRDGSNARQVTR